MKAARKLFLCLSTLVLVHGAAHADVVTDWNAIANTRVASQLPPDQSRVMAMVHVAMFDAINAITPRYAPYAFKGTAPDGASPEAAAAAAAKTVLVKLYPDQRAALEKAYAASLAAVPD